MAKKKKAAEAAEAVDGILEVRSVGPTEPVVLVGRLFAAFAARGIPGVLDELEQVSDEGLLDAVAARLRDGFGRADLADLVLDRLKKIRLDIGGPEAPKTQLIKTTTRGLPVKLTPEEVAAYSHEALGYHQEADTLEAAAKSAMKEAKEEFDSIRRLAKDVGGRAFAGEEKRTVDVAIHWDAQAQKVVEIRTDSGEEIERRDPTPDERQLPLFQGAL